MGLSGDDILMAARILAVADAVVTLSSAQGPAAGLDQGLEGIEAGRGTIYDADVVDACVELLRGEGLGLLSATKYANQGE
jgi:HD-GYP domain-containing protein (c-di-GMP phosphodiesterase class II)